MKFKVTKRLITEIVLIVEAENEECAIRDTGHSHYGENIERVKDTDATEYRIERHYGNLASAD